MPDTPMNVAFKVTWVYGEYGPWSSPCSPEGRLINILREGKVWCSQPDCPCHELLDTDDRLPAGAIPCYDCRAPLDFRFTSGLHPRGPRKGEPIPMRRTGVGKFAFLTSRRHDMTEAERIVVACFRIDHVGDHPDLRGYAVWADEGSPHALRVPLDRLDEAPRFWGLPQDRQGPTLGQRAIPLHPRRRSRRDAGGGRGPVRRG